MRKESDKDSTFHMLKKDDQLILTRMQPFTQGEGFLSTALPMTTEVLGPYQDPSVMDALENYLRREGFKLDELSPSEGSTPSANRLIEHVLQGRSLRVLFENLLRGK